MCEGPLTSRPRPGSCDAVPGLAGEGGGGRFGVGRAERVGCRWAAGLCSVQSTRTTRSSLESETTSWVDCSRHKATRPAGRLSESAMPICCAGGEPDDGGVLVFRVQLEGRLVGRNVRSRGLSVTVECSLAAMTGCHGPLAASASHAFSSDSEPGRSFKLSRGVLRSCQLQSLLFPATRKPAHVSVVIFIIHDRHANQLLRSASKRPAIRF